MLSILAPTLASLNIESLRSTERAFRSDIISRTLRKRDLNSFLHLAITVAGERYPFEGASIFLWDAQRTLLKLHSTTGLAKPHPKTEVFYRRGEDRITVRAATTGLASVTDSIPSDHRVPGKFEEKVIGPRESFAAFPIFDWGQIAQPQQVMPMGVLRIINRRIANRSKGRAVPFGWDDLVVFRFVAEVIGVVTNYLRQSMQAQDHFERVIHGIKANVVAVAQNLALLNSGTSFTVNLPELKYVLPDCLAMMNDLKWQVDRNVAWHRPRYDTGTPEDRLQIAPVKLTGDVLAKIKGLIPEMASVHSVGQVVWEYASYEDFIRLPPVDGEPSALMTVFRNIAENAIKYTRQEKNHSPRIIVSSRYEKVGYLDILVDDNGIGVPQGDEDWIFVDGYRCDNAMRRRPGGGSGIGLPHSKQLMHQMGGDLLYERLPDKTRFVVRLKLTQEARK